MRWFMLAVIMAGFAVIAYLVYRLHAALKRERAWEDRIRARYR